MNKLKIKKGDTVKIVAGNDKGKTGKVLRAFPDTEHVVVEDVHMVKKHQRARQRNQKGQIVDRPMPIHVSNVKRTGGKETASKKPARRSSGRPGKTKVKK